MWGGQGPYKDCRATDDDDDDTHIISIYLTCPNSMFQYARPEYSDWNDSEI
jgi:hypothetical protein